MCKTESKKFNLLMTNPLDGRNTKKLKKQKLKLLFFFVNTRVSVQGVKSLGGHFACLCREFS